MQVQGRAYRTVWWEQGAVRMINQRLLPHAFDILACPASRDTARAITDMTVRGAGAIGAAAGFAMAQGICEASAADFRRDVDACAAAIRATRPTAQDLFAAVEEVLAASLKAATPAAARAAAVAAAEAVADRNAEAGHAIGRIGVSLLRPGMRILTHCNAGWLAFVDWGSALAPIYYGHRAGIPLFVYATETRPRSQGAKLTEWELSQAGVPHRLVADTAAGSLFQRKQVDAVIVGADRIAANGDVANKIGTYTLAVLAKRHGVPFYVAAPRSTVDFNAPTGSAIPIEARSEEEVLYVWGRTDEGAFRRVRIAGEGAQAENPAFDVTPAELVTRFVTEFGLVAPDAASLRAYREGLATAQVP